MNYFILKKSENTFFNYMGLILIFLMNLSLQAMSTVILTHSETNEIAINIVQAIELNRIDIVKIMLEKGQDPNKIICGVNPLLAAIFQKNADIVALLLAHGAKKVRKVREEDESLITFAEFLERHGTPSIKKMLEDHSNSSLQHNKQDEKRSQGIWALTHSRIMAQVFPLGIIFIIITGIFEDKK